MPISDNSSTAEFEYAGFVSRAIASFVDSVIVILVAGAAFAVAVGIFAASSNAAVLLFGLFGSYALVIFLVVAYYPLFEGSSHQATPGKMLMGIKVAREDGGMVTPGTAWLRMLGRLISNMTCYVGYLIALFSERKQTLHDILAKTIVIKK